MTLFEDEKLKPGVYKIQNIFIESYVDIHLGSMEVCCRPAKDLEKGRGLVRPYLPSDVHRSDNYEVGVQNIWGRACDSEGELSHTILLPPIVSSTMWNPG
jgi:hypothetical protein